MACLTCLTAFVFVIGNDFASVFMIALVIGAILTLGVLPVFGVNNLAFLFDNVESIEYTELVMDLTDEADLGELLLRIILYLGLTTRNTFGDTLVEILRIILGEILRTTLGALRTTGVDTLLTGVDTLLTGVDTLLLGEDTTNLEATLRTFWIALRVGVDTLRLGDTLASFLIALRVGVDTVDLGETMRSFLIALRVGVDTRLGVTLRTFLIALRTGVEILR